VRFAAAVEFCIIKAQSKHFVAGNQLMGWAESCGNMSYVGEIIWRALKTY